MLVADTDNHSIRKVTRSGAVSTLAGTVQPGFVDGVGADARFNEPVGIALDAHGTIFIADNQNHCLRQLKPGDRTVSTVAGDGERGFADGQGAAARFNDPCGIAIDAHGHIIVADLGNDCIRKVMSAEGRVTTVAGCAGYEGFADGSSPSHNLIHTRQSTPHPLI